MVFKSTIYGLLGTTALLAVYFSIVSLISGWPFAVSQFSQFWYFIISLAVGFGIQIGLYTYLKTVVHHKNASGGVLAVSGTTSTVAMISCCAHYLTNILPIIGTIGVINFINQYQAEFFWVGLAFNVAGIAYISRKIIIFSSLMTKNYLAATIIILIAIIVVGFKVFNEYDENQEPQTLG